MGKPTLKSEAGFCSPSCHDPTGWAGQWRGELQCLTSGSLGGCRHASSPVCCQGGFQGEGALGLRLQDAQGQEEQQWPGGAQGGVHGGLGHGGAGADPRARSAAVRFRHHLRGRVPAGAALRAAQQLGGDPPGRAQVRARAPAPGGRARAGRRHLVPHPGGHHAPGRHQQRERAASRGPGPAGTAGQRRGPRAGGRGAPPH